MQTTSNYKLKKPEGTDPVDVRDFNDNADILDVELKKRPTESGNASEMTTQFSQAATRTNIVSGEALKTAFGKIMKWFAELKDAAFASVANNDTTTAAGYVADARAVRALGIEIDTANKALTTHKTSTDHDNRYYTETEIDNKISAINTDLNTKVNNVMSKCDVLLDYSDQYLGPTSSFIQVLTSYPYQNYRSLVFEVWVVSDLDNRVFAELSTAAFIQGALPLLIGSTFKMAFYTSNTLGTMRYNLSGVAVHCRIFGVK